MNLIKVALSHCCCRTTLQCHRCYLVSGKYDARTALQIIRTHSRVSVQLSL